MKRPLTVRLLREQGGAVAIEFAVMATLLMLILAAVVDIGSAGIISLRLNSEATAAADYVLLQPSPQDDEAATALATVLAELLRSGGTTDVEVDVNNAAVAHWAGGSVSAAAGGDTSACYCPETTRGALNWGSPVACNAPCGTGDTAGQFVGIRLGARYVPLFSGFGFLDNNTVEVRTMIRLP